MRFGLAEKLSLARAEELNVTGMFSSTFDDDSIKKDFVDTLLHITQK